MTEIELTQEVIGAAFQVHNTLGYGFLEQVYHNALCVELYNRRIPFESKKKIEIIYKGCVVGNYEADIVVGGNLILELKAVAALCPEHEVQLVNYLKATGINTGLLINFGRSVEIKRKTFTLNYKKEIKD